MGANNVVIALSDAEIADFLNRHFFYAMQISWGLAPSYAGDMIQDDALNGYVYVYRDSNGANRFLWSHDADANWQTTAQVVTGAIAAGAGAAVKAAGAAADWTKTIATLAVIGFGLYVVYESGLLKSKQRGVA